MDIGKHRKGFRFWFLQIPGWFLLIYLVIAQGISAFSYNLGIKMGTQESPELITEIGTAFWYGFAFGDMFIYIPVLLAGLIGHFFDKVWGRALFYAALGITVYWPIVCLAAISAARKSPDWYLDNEAQYWIVLPLITGWGILGFILLIRESQPVAGGDAAR